MSEIFHVGNVSVMFKVLYKHVSFSVGNYSLQTSASPLLHEVMFEVHRMTDDPYKTGMSVFDKARLVYKDKFDPKNHKIYQLGAGSDYYAFYKFVGIPSIDMGYRQKDLVWYLLWSSYLSNCVTLCVQPKVKGN